MTEIVVEREAIKRLAKDVKMIIKNPQRENGIYYEHDNDNILRGKALIIGPSDTPYKNGFYLFEFEYPPNYPHAPPKVTYHTNDGVTRFNPNLYRSGKVCVSILNTWRGDQWSSCQTITSVLLTICTLLNNNPLLNEPGITETHSEIEKYNKLITYKNFQVAICGVLEQEYFRNKFSIFRDVVVDHFLSNYNNIISEIDKNMDDDKMLIETKVYRHSVTLDYTKLRIMMENMFNKLNKLPKNKT